MQHILFAEWRSQWVSFAAIELVLAELVRSALVGGALRASRMAISHIDCGRHSTDEILVATLLGHIVWRNSKTRCDVDHVVTADVT